MSLKDLVVSRGSNSNDILLLESKDYIKDSKVTIMYGKCMYMLWLLVKTLNVI